MYRCVPQAVIDTLGEMMGQDSMYVLPSIEALSNLCLSPEEQARVVQMVLDRFQSADAADLPAVTRFLLQYAAPGPELKQVESNGRSVALLVVEVCSAVQCSAVQCCEVVPVEQPETLLLHWKASSLGDTAVRLLAADPNHKPTNSFPPPRRRW
jgi:hypothetical protein